MENFIKAQKLALQGLQQQQAYLQGIRSLREQMLWDVANKTYQEVIQLKSQEKVNE